MIARCDVCESVIVATYRHTRRQYQCRTGGRVLIDADDLDAYAEGQMLDYLCRPDNVERLAADDDHDEELAAVRDDQARIRAELDDLAERVGRGEVSATLAARAEPLILERLRAVDRRVEELATPSSLRGLLAPGDDLSARWRQAPMSAKREAARMLLAPTMLGTLYVNGRRPGTGRLRPSTGSAGALESASYVDVV